MSRLDENLRPVSRADIEQLWAQVRERTADSNAGIFGPQSVSWRVNRESALFLGAGRAALLQLAHPWVAAALDQHSNLRNDPLARFHNTFRVVFTMIFGTLDQALAASRHLYDLHTHIEGALPERVARYPEGSPYRANEVGALIWVYATLVESALLAYELVLPPLSAIDREAYYNESKIMAALFGIPANALPKTWPEFESYTAAMMPSNHLGVSAISRDLAQRVLHGRGSWVPVPLWYRALTAEWLPEQLRVGFELCYDEQQVAARGRALHWLPKLYRHLPSSLRFVGPFQEANARLRGRTPGLPIQASNRFWMGQPRMMFPELGIPPKLGRP